MIRTSGKLSDEQSIGQYIGDCRHRLDLVVPQRRAVVCISRDRAPSIRPPIRVDAVRNEVIASRADCTGGFVLLINNRDLAARRRGRTNKNRQGNSDERLIDRIVKILFEIVSQTERYLLEMP